MPRERVHHGQVLLTVEHPGTDDVPGAITTQRYDPANDVPAGGTLTEEPSLDVSWNRDGSWVQVAYVAPVVWWDKFHTDAVYGSVYGDNYRVAYTNVLTRQEINNLIRTLRRARDAAYGSDE